MFLESQRDIDGERSDKQDERSRNKGEGRGSWQVVRKCTRELVKVEELY